MEPGVRLQGDCTTSSGITWSRSPWRHGLTWYYLALWAKATIIWSEGPGCVEWYYLKWWPKVCWVTILGVEAHGATDWSDITWRDGLRWLLSETRAQGVLPGVRVQGAMDWSYIDTILTAGREERWLDEQEIKWLVVIVDQIQLFRHSETWHNSSYLFIEISHQTSSIIHKPVSQPTHYTHNQIFAGVTKIKPLRKATLDHIWLTQ